MVAQVCANPVRLRKPGANLRIPRAYQGVEEGRRTWAFHLPDLDHGR